MSRHLIKLGLGALALGLVFSGRSTPASFATISESDTSQIRAEPPSMPLPLRVLKTQVLNSRGEVVRLRGVNTASLEWTSDGEKHILETVKTAIEQWRVNHIRLPLSQDRWFGKAPEQKDQGKSYRALVQQVVDLCSRHQCYII